VTEAGTADGSNTSAVANVTPLTEMIVAKLAGALPADLFASFSASNQITSDLLQAATTAVVTALKDATDIDLDSIGPFKTHWLLQLLLRLPRAMTMTRRSMH
jgi:hypothetical protein